MLEVLLVSDGIWHPPFLGRITLHRTLARMGGYHLQRVRTLETLNRLKIGDFSAVVIYIHHKEISPAALDALEDFVINGGGLLGIHSATASFKQAQRYFEILGGRFIGHGKIESFEVTPVPGSNDPFGGLGKFTVKDELYLHENRPGIVVHFTATHEGQEAPVVWTFGYGRGRVCYIMPGHRSATMRNPTVQQILRKGLDWVCQN